VRAAAPHVQERVLAPSTLTPCPGIWSTPKNLSFGINMHFLRHFQQWSLCSVVHASTPPLPAAWRMHPAAHHHPKLQRGLVQGTRAPGSPRFQPALMDRCQGRAGGGRCPWFSTSWGFQVRSCSQKFKTNVPNPRPSPGCRKKTTPDYTAPSGSTFSWILEQTPAHHLCDAAGKGSQSPGRRHRWARVCPWAIAAS